MGEGGVGEEENARRGEDIAVNLSFGDE